MSQFSSSTIDEVAKKIERLGLKEISLFFLESHLPLANVIAHLAYLVPPVFGKSYLELLKDPKSIEMLVQRLKVES